MLLWPSQSLDLNLKWELRRNKCLCTDRNSSGNEARQNLLLKEVLPAGGSGSGLFLTTPSKICKLISFHSYVASALLQHRTGPIIWFPTEGSGYNWSSVWSLRVCRSLMVYFIVIYSLVPLQPLVPTSWFMLTC